MSAEHTPGTWAVVDDKGEDYTVCAFEGDPANGIMSGVICEVCSINEVADAYLLAAAPDLLAFVQMIAASDPVFAKGRQKQVIADARALVAKATGSPLSTASALSLWAD